MVLIARQRPAQDLGRHAADTGRFRTVFAQLCVTDPARLSGGSEALSRGTGETVSFGRVDWGCR
ncbi:hypothetical protein ACQPXM_02100 [Kribbella sp. CA-253562]|uniref:hypothetical protein n=1 Tax=Kribbella sp. CA-253562 TaxID=3239942 RepID=UPI003D8C7F80